jgi:hypothetical protein
MFKVDYKQRMKLSIREKSGRLKVGRKKETRNKEFQQEHTEPRKQGNGF